VISESPNVLVLLSGGIDSSACITYYLSQKFPVQALFVDYGQVAAQREFSAAFQICNYYDVNLNKVTATGFKKWSGGYIPGRNAFLLYTALMSFSRDTGLIAIGIHAGTSYSDCSELFIHKLQSSFDLYTDGCIQIGVPFVTWNKRSIWSYCNAKEVPLDLTYSCELGEEPPCGRCSSCKDLEALRAG